MTTLTVREFSCIRQATVELGRLNILIGPQASGKSILSKLFYFFFDALETQYTRLPAHLELDEFRSEISRSFTRWFPVTAWGSQTFEILFIAGDACITITRKKPWRKPSSEFHVVFGEEFERRFHAYVKKLRELRAPLRGTELEFHSSFGLYELGRSHLAGLLGSDYIDGQSFVPAGRSFFTSVGKAIAVFEQGNVLDPATLDFGRFWAAARDRRLFAPPHLQAPHHLVEKIFGGRLIRERDLEYVKAGDGRKIPLTSLSSGQQELLPLWVALQYRFSRPDRDYLMYIEEPEAHLFPEAQSQLIEHLTSLVTGRADKRRLFMTTHSPYVLTKLNNLLKAGELGYRASKDRQSLISEVVPKASWLRPQQLRAYAIVDGEVQSILGDDGLIHGDYLDSASATLSAEFEALLDIEYSTSKRGKLKD